MKFNKLVSEIARREGKKSQARIGDIREILKILETIMAEDLANHWKTDETAAVNNALLMRVMVRAEKIQKKAKRAKK